MRLALVLTLLLAACGGGSAPVTGPITPAPSLRADLLFGYYYSNSSTVNETSAHANLHWASYELGPAEQMAGLIQARANGQSVMLMLPGFHDVARDRREGEYRLWLSRLRDAGLLWPGIVALYPVDEPDLQGLSDSQVSDANADLRRVVGEFPDLVAPRLAVFYSCSSGKRPGLASYDWVGCDDYDRGCSVLAPSGAARDLLAALRPDQRLMVIPGGADPWRQDPACFESFAHGEPRVVALIAFLWQRHSAPGIRDNGMRALYCQAGRKINGTTGPC